MSGLIDFPGNIPILGQTFKILSHYPTAIVQCTCDAKTVIVLVQCGVVGVCKCGRKFAIGTVGPMQIGQLATESHA